MDGWTLTSKDKVFGTMGVCGEVTAGCPHCGWMDPDLDGQGLWDYWASVVTAGCPQWGWMDPDLDGQGLWDCGRL